MFLPLLIAWLASRIHRHQEHAIQYLRGENRLLHAQLTGKRMPLTDTERRRLAIVAHPIARKPLNTLSTIATPDTLRCWYRRFVAQGPSRSLQDKILGRPRVRAEIEQRVVRMANENPTWGYRRLQGALANVGYHIDNTTVRNILRRNHIDPVPIRGQTGRRWSQFVKLHLEVLAASGGFDTPLSMLTHLLTVVTQIGRDLSTRGIQRRGVIHHGAMRVLGWLAQQCRTLWARWCTHVDSQWRIVFARRRRAPDGVLPPLRLASSCQAARQLMPRPAQLEREPPAAHRFLSPSRAAPERYLLRRQLRDESAFPASSQAAA